MPALVDHDERRRQVAEVAARLVAAGGAEAATVRAVAQAAGCSTKIVSHYFADKRALLLMTYRHAAEHSGEVADASQGGAPDVAAYLVSLLPMDESLQRDWRVWFAFWGRAITDVEFAAEQRSQVRRARLRIAELLRIDPLFAGLSPARRQAEARALLTTVIGIALQAVFDPRDWPAVKQTALLRERLLVAQCCPRSTLATPSSRR